MHHFKSKRIYNTDNTRASSIGPFFSNQFVQVEIFHFEYSDFIIEYVVRYFAWRYNVCIDCISLQQKSLIPRGPSLVKLSKMRLTKEE